MKDGDKSEDRPAASVKAVEVGVAVVILLFGALVAYDSYRIGARWGDDGPQAGYVPFYVGLLIIASAAVSFARALRGANFGAKAFVSRGQLKLILVVLVPTVVYVGVIAWLGIYLASMLYIGCFMLWLGRYSWAISLTVALGISIAFFLTFEVWFKVPLPKGPLEAALGLN